MADIKSFPNNQDVFIGAQEVMRWHHGRTSGVFAGDGNAVVSALADAAMAVSVADGVGWISNADGDGIVWWNDNESANGEKLQITIDAADGVLNRIDRIVVEWETTNYVAYPEIKVLKGETSSTATAPMLTNDATKRQISLAQVKVSAGVTAITGSMITDERLDNAVCGLVTESVTADTSGFNAQLVAAFEEYEASLNAAHQQYTADMNAFTTASEAAFDAWFENLQTQLSGDVAANLQNQIDHKQPMHIARTVEIAVADWDEDTNQCTKSVADVTADNSLVVSPSPDSFSAYCEAQIRAPAQGDDSITFVCENIPDTTVTVNVMILGVGV